MGEQARDNKKHFSMIRSFTSADWLTLGNGFSGAGAILALVQHVATGEQAWLTLAFVLFPLALVLDFADGRVARWRRRASPLGADLDSLSDIISFGVAPAVLAFVLGMRGAMDVVVLLYFVGCGISRLARFNVTAEVLADESGKVRYFEGTPIPTSVALVGVLAVCTALGRVGDHMLLGVVELGPVDFHPLVLIYALSGSAMISKSLHIPKL